MVFLIKGISVAVLPQVFYHIFRGIERASVISLKVSSEISTSSSLQLRRETLYNIVYRRGLNLMIELADLRALNGLN